MTIYNIDKHTYKRLHSNHVYLLFSCNPLKTIVKLRGVKIDRDSGIVDSFGYPETHVMSEQKQSFSSLIG